MRRTKLDTEKTIDGLLDSAIVLFIKKGYASVTLEQIAAGAGMTRGALYHHFSSREDILNALIRRERNSFENKLESLFLEKHDPTSHLKKILDHIIANFFGNKRFNRFIHFTWFRIEEGHIGRRFLYQGATNERLVKELSVIIRRGQRNGAFANKTSAVVLALGITTTILGIYRLYFQAPSIMTREKAFQLMRQQLRLISDL